jgi:hypothetical protein
VSNRFREVVLVISTAAVVAMLTLAVSSTAGQAPAGFKAARMADGHPDLNGVWQALNTANWNLLSHGVQPALATRPGRVQGTVVPAAPVLAFGAVGGVPAGLGVVEGDVIPYQPAAAAKRKENADNWLMRDPEIKCFLPGVPRATYMPYPFQIVQGTDRIKMAYEFAGATRTIEMGGKDEAPIDMWMGWSNGRWEGDTLVVDVSNFNGRTWLDMAANFVDENEHVVERFSLVDHDTIQYEATITDPTVFLRPVQMRFTLKRLPAEQQILEYSCLEGERSLQHYTDEDGGKKRRQQ